METAPGASESTHTHASGVFASPVDTQAQVMRRGLRTVKYLLFIVPPLAVGQALPNPAPEARTGRRHESSVREG